MTQPPSALLTALAAAALLTACQSGASANFSAATPAVPAAATAVDQQTPGRQLLAAAAQGDAVAVRNLLAGNAPVDVQDAQGNTPLLLATAANHIEVARSLLLHGASPNIQNQMQDSAYLLAGAQGRLEIVRMTISYGADLKSTNRYGGTALIPACERGHVETAQALIAAGVDVNHVNRLGWTCLMEAVVLSDGGPRHQSIIKALIEARADLNLPDKNGVTALAHARQRGQVAVVQLLQAAGAR
ncbi:ankyrin repeat domain-containing protein [Comamonas guangdongensis]|uniref:Ankyrin repeat domain-containing protein n=1 Tax=Comamonas guangdongensis TaxID=510515 RepID=A0ABV4A0R7_9BURK